MSKIFYTLVQRRDFSASVFATQDGVTIPVVEGASEYGVPIQLKADVVYPDPFFTSDYDGHTQTRLESLDDVIIL